MSDETEIPTVDSDQISELSTAGHAMHTQMCTFKFGDGDDSRIYVVMWDGDYLRLLQPHYVDTENSVIAYKIIGHLEVSLPKILDPITMERQAQILAASYHDNLNATEDDATEDD